MHFVSHVGNARETVINSGYGEWVVDEVTGLDNYQVREGVCHGPEERQGRDFGSSARGDWPFA